MRSQKRLPFQKALDPNKKLNDQSIAKIISTLNQVKVKDFPNHDKWLSIENILTVSELRSFHLAKYLYCIGYKKEMFLHLGIIIESKLNNIIKIYEIENWQTPQNFVDENKQKIIFEHFQNKKALSEKADMILSLNLFNNIAASEMIKHKIQSFRFLRNYGGHSKSINQFLQLVIDTQPECDDEIDNTFSLIRKIEAGILYLKSNPPPQL